VAIKRLKYFTHQFLREQDFEAEQNYHIAMRRLHNRSVHGWGVVEGLVVRKKNDKEITIDPGVAIDGEGREIILANQVTRDLSSLERNSRPFITISYGESWEDSDRYSSGGIEGYTRVSETPLIGERNSEAPKDGSVLTLARVRINENGNLNDEIETHFRTEVNTRSSVAGWFRMPFRPMRMEPLRVGGKLVPPKQWDPSVEFTVDVASAYCEKGARGSMDIPVPPGASKITDFRICGTTGGRVEVELLRGGWNLEEGKGEKKEVWKRTVERTADREAFDEHAAIAEDRQHLGELHTLSIGVVAEGKTEIWLVAARFE
jgi:hypothetical protein